MNHSILSRFVDTTKEFTSTEEFAQQYKVNIPDNFNFAYDIVDAWAEIAPNKRAICWVNEKGEHLDFTFSQLKEKSDQVASILQAHGIGKGDMVMLMLKRRYEFWFFILALHKLGCVAIPATHLLTAKDIIYRCNAADIKAIVCTEEPEMHQKVNEAKLLSSTLKTCVALDNAPQDWINYKNEIKAQYSAFIRPEGVNTNEQMMLLYFTSGTTGNPKMVAHNFVYPLGHIITAKYWHNLHEDSLHLTVADTGWAKSVWGKLYGQWIVGAAIFIYDHERFNPKDILQLIQTYKITSFCAPPTVYRFMIRENIKAYDLSSLEYCTTAGEALNPSVFEAFYEATGLKMREAFGQTETTASIITFPWIEPRPGAMGIANPFYHIELIKSDGTPAKPNEQGEIIFHTHKGKPLGLFMGYYKDIQLTEQVYHDDTYHTGDIAYRDEDGYFWFVGRTDDVIKSSGYRIGPFEVESAVMTHPAVVECAVTGVPDEIRGMLIKATVVLAPSYKQSNQEDLKKEIQEHVKRVTAPYKYPRIVEFVDTLPKTISGKIRRVEIRNKK